MPLVVITGQSCTGKSLVARALARRLAACGHDCVLLGPRGEALPADAPPAAALQPAPAPPPVSARARGGVLGLRAAVERALAASPSAAVVADACNDTKSFRCARARPRCRAPARMRTHPRRLLARPPLTAPPRYELYCAARAAGTTHAVLGLRPPPRAVVAAWAAARGGADDDGDAEARWRAYEPPDAAARWDAPLFIVETEEVAAEAAARGQSGGGGGGGGGDEAAPALAHTLDALIGSIYGRRGLRPVAATQPSAAAPPAYVHALDRASAGVVAHIAGTAAARETGAAAEPLAVPGCDEFYRARRRPALGELRTLKRAFDRRAEAAPLPENDLVRSFVVFLNAAAAAEEHEEDAAAAAAEAAEAAAAAVAGARSNSKGVT
jgi:hypothetical protein